MGAYIITQSQYCLLNLFLHIFYNKKVLSYEMFLTLLLPLFASNPLISWWLYYTAESIFEGIKAIKSFIYPYLEQTPKNSTV